MQSIKLSLLCGMGGWNVDDSSIKYNLWCYQTKHFYSDLHMAFLTSLLFVYYNVNSDVCERY